MVASPSFYRRAREPALNGLRPDGAAARDSSSGSFSFLPTAPASTKVARNCGIHRRDGCDFVIDARRTVASAVPPPPYQTLRGEPCGPSRSARLPQAIAALSLRLRPPRCDARRRRRSQPAGSGPSINRGQGRLQAVCIESGLHRAACAGAAFAQALLDREASFPSSLSYISLAPSDALSAFFRPDRRCRQA